MKKIVIDGTIPSSISGQRDSYSSVAMYQSGMTHISSSKIFKTAAPEVHTSRVIPRMPRPLGRNEIRIAQSIGGRMASTEDHRRGHERPESLSNPQELSDRKYEKYTAPNRGNSSLENQKNIIRENRSVLATSTGCKEQEDFKVMQISTHRNWNLDDEDNVFGIPNTDVLTFGKKEKESSKQKVIDIEQFKSLQSEFRNNSSRESSRETERQFEVEKTRIDLDATTSNRKSKQPAIYRLDLKEIKMLASKNTVERESNQKEKKSSKSRKNAKKLNHHSRGRLEGVLSKKKSHDETMNEYIVDIHKTIKGIVTNLNIEQNQAQVQSYKELHKASLLSSRKKKIRHEKIGNLNRNQSIDGTSTILKTNISDFGSTVMQNSVNGYGDELVAKRQKTTQSSIGKVASKTRIYPNLGHPRAPPSMKTQVPKAKSTRKKAGPDIRYIHQIYEESLAKVEMKKKSFVKREESLEECTFKPSLVADNKLRTNLNFEQRQEAWLDKLARKKLNQEKQKRAKEKDECTFIPKTKRSVSRSRLSSEKERDFRNKFARKTEIINQKVCILVILEKGEGSIKH